MAKVKVVLAAATYTSLETQADALGDGVFKVTSDLADLDVGLVTAGETPSVLPAIDQAAQAVEVYKTHGSTLELWAHSVIGGEIQIENMGNPVVVDVTGTTSA